MHIFEWKAHMSTLCHSFNKTWRFCLLNYLKDLIIKSKKSWFKNRQQLSFLGGVQISRDHILASAGPPPSKIITLHSALQEDTGFSIVTQETDDIFKIFKQIHDWKS